MASTCLLWSFALIANLLADGNHAAGARKRAGSPTLRACGSCLEQLHMLCGGDAQQPKVAHRQAAKYVQLDFLLQHRRTWQMMSLAA